MAWCIGLIKNRSRLFQLKLNLDGRERDCMTVRNEVNLWLINYKATYVSSLNWLLSFSLILFNARIRTIMRISWKDANSRPFFVCFSRPRYDNLPPNIICFSPNHRSVFYFLFSDFVSLYQRCPVCYISWICLSESVFNKNEALVTINKTSRSLMSHKIRYFLYTL